MRDTLERRVNIEELGNPTRENLSAEYAPAATQVSQSPLTPEPTLWSFQPSYSLYMGHWISLVVFFKIGQLSFTSVYLLTVFFIIKMFLSPNLSHFHTQNWSFEFQIKNHFIWEAFPDLQSKQHNLLRSSHGPWTFLRISQLIMICVSFTHSHTILHVISTSLPPSQLHEVKDLIRAL